MPFILDLCIRSKSPIVYVFGPLLGWLNRRRPVLNRLPWVLCLIVLGMGSVTHAFIGPLSTLVPLPGAEPVAWGKEGQSWKTRTSPHFELHFPMGFESQAERALGIAEQVHQDLVPFFGSEPASRTRMVLVDDVDYSNGWATPLPYPQIRLFASPPDDVTGLENYDDWLHMLIRHEYVHILHMEMASGLVSKSRYVFGRMSLTFPHALTPSFLLEGLAVYLETSHDKGYGRLQGTLYDMQMREEVASGNLASLNQVMVPNRDWPRNKAYLYGAFFIDFLVKQYGQDRLQYFLKSYSRSLIPYVGLNGHFRRAFGASLSAQWRMFLYGLEQHYQPRIDALDAVSTASSALPSVPWSQQPVRAVGDRLISLESNGDDVQSIWEYRWPASSTEPERNKLREVRNVRDLAVSQRGTLAYVRLLATADRRIQGDIYVVDDRGNDQRLTHQLRARRVQWLPDETGLIATRISGGISELLLVNLEGEVASLWRGEYGSVIGGFDLSADGDRIVASLKRPGQAWNLEQFDRTQRRWVALTRTRSLEHSPTWLDQNRVLYSADYDGVYDLYVLTTATGLIERWTQENTGAFRPQWVNGRLVYQRYTADGYQLVEVNAPNTLERTNIASLSGAMNYPPVVVEDVSQSEDTDYQPWSSLLPTAWYPYYYWDSYQNVIMAQIPGVDALGKHFYLLSVGRDNRNNAVPASLYYQYDTRWSVFGSRTYEYSYGAPQAGRDQKLQKDLVIAERRYLWRGFDDELGLHAGVTLERETLKESAGLPWIDGAPGSKGLAGLALVFTDFEGLLNIPGVAKGRRWDWVLESNDLLQSDYNGMVTQVRGATVLDLPGRQTLSIGGSLGWANEEADQFELGGFLGDQTLFGRDQIPLSGYDDDVQRGHQYTTQRVGYTRWLTRPERNFGLLPIGLGDISGTLFVENGAAWESGRDPEWLASIGVEVHTELVFGYNWRAPLTVIVAQALDDRVDTSSVGIRFGYRY